MNVYYINGRYDGCFYVRCYLPLFHNLWDGNKTSMYTEQVSSEKAFQGAMSADIVVFHRPDQRQKVEVIPLLQQYGKKVVVDNDDTYQPDSGTPAQMLYGKKELLEKVNANLMEAVASADLVTTTTEYLAEEYREYNDNVIVLPNCVDPDDWDKPIRNDTNKIRIGLVGSVTNTRDYEVIGDLLKELSDSPDYQLVVFGLPPDNEKSKMMNDIYKTEIAFWKSLDIEWQPFVEAHQYQETLRQLKLDIALIPREECYFNKCKSNLKFLEMSMLEIPCIASGWKDNPYNHDKKHISLCNTERGWRSAIKKLSDGKVRRDRGANAREYVMRKYNIKKKKKLWVKAYEQLLNN